MNLTSQNSRNENFQEELDSAILGQFVHHEDAENLPENNEPQEIQELDEHANLFLNELSDLFDGLLSSAPEQELDLDEENYVKPEDEIIENGMSLNDFLKLQTMAENEAANYDKEVQLRNANQHVRETLADLDTAAGIYGDIEGAPSHFASAENHLVQADVENSEAHRNGMLRDKMENVESIAERAISAAPAPSGPKQS